MNIKTIIEHIDNYLIRTGQKYIDPVEANISLEKANLLPNSASRPGKPLRDILRKGLISHAYQTGGKGSSWVIPHSSKGNIVPSNYSPKMADKHKISKGKSADSIDNKMNFDEVKKQLEKARLKYKPKKIKYLLIAEAAPDSLERFFYFEDVKQHDYLFLGVTEAIYPELKNQFLGSGRDIEIKASILEKFKSDGFYLLDLSELPISLLDENLKSQLPILVIKIEAIIEQQTRIILIKSNVYNLAYSFLINKGFTNVIDIKIPFPGQGWQRKFQVEFKKALNEVGYK